MGDGPTRYDVQPHTKIVTLLEKTVPKLPNDDHSYPALAFHRAQTYYKQFIYPNHHQDRRRQYHLLSLGHKRWHLCEIESYQCVVLHSQISRRTVCIQKKKSNLHARRGEVLRPGIVVEIRSGSNWKINSALGQEQPLPEFSIQTSVESEYKYLHEFFLRKQGLEALQVWERTRHVPGCIPAF